MATEVDLQKLVVQLEASFTKYDRAWSKAMGETETNVKRVSAKFDVMAKSINGAGASTARALDPIAGQTGNIAAQFQDIAVQLQGGQSPFLIAMQQGTQLSAVLNQAKSPIAALSSAFLQMVNPISVATIAAIALGGAAVQYLGTLLGDGKSATEVIKEQNDVIRRVAENWGDAVPALKAYVDQLDRASQQKDTEQAYDAIVAQQFEKAKADLEDIRVGFVDARVALEDLGASAQEIDALQTAFDALRGKVAANEDPTRELEALQRLLAVTVFAETTPALIGLSGVLNNLSNALATAAQQTAVLRSEQSALREADRHVEKFNANREFVEEQRRINGLTSQQLALENEIARVREEAKRSDILVSDQQALQIAQERLSAEERRSQIAQSARSTGRAEDRERQAVLDLISALEHEQALLGLTEQQKAVANALRQAGASATDAQRASIESLVNATYEERAALEATNEQMREFQEIASSALKSFISDVMAGKDATEALGNALNNIGSRLLNAGVDGLFGAAFGGGGGGGIGNIFGKLFGGGRALGGAVEPGRIYKVNENTPNSEYWMPTRPGVVMPRLPHAGGGGPAISIGDIVINGGADAMTVGQLRQWSRFELPSIIRQHASSSIPVNG